MPNNYHLSHNYNDVFRWNSGHNGNVTTSLNPWSAPEIQQRLSIIKQSCQHENSHSQIMTTATEVTGDNPLHTNAEDHTA